MGSLWFRDDGSRELARLASAVGQIERAADRQARFGRNIAARKLRRLAMEGRFRPVAELAERYRVLVETPNIEDQPDISASRMDGWSGQYDCLRFTVTPGEVRVDGGRAWRNHNPGYLVHDLCARDQKAIGSDKGLAIFPDYTTGRVAFEQFLQSDAGGRLTVAEVCLRSIIYEDTLPVMIPDSDAISANIGCPPDARIKDLDELQRTRLADTLSEWALSWEGHRYAAVAADQDVPRWVLPRVESAMAHPEAPYLSLNVTPICSFPAERYFVASDLCVIAAFFNPCMSQLRTRHFRSFLQTLISSRVHWRCVECAFGNNEFELSADPAIIQIRSRSVMWQKERLLNAVIKTLPDRFVKVAWLDGDVLFSNPAWIVDTSAALDDHSVVQPFQYAIRLPSDRTCLPLQTAERTTSFAAEFENDPDTVVGNDFWSHGHTGFAWAGRREWLQEHGLYDASLSGTADHLMAHAFVGAWECPCVFERMKVGPRWTHFRDWCKEVYPSIRSQLGSVTGTVLSEWHGSTTVRNDAYYRADHHLDELSFDPIRDLKVNALGAWEWATNRPVLHQWAVDYFQQREHGLVAT